MKLAMILRFPALALTACATSGGGAPPSDDISAMTFNAALGVDLSVMTRTATGLYTRELAPGTGIPATAGDLVKIRYELSLADGTLIGGTAPADQPFEFRLGRRQVIAGWDEGITGMRVGERRQLVVPPSLGYGVRSRGEIPPNAILVFNVQLIDIEK
jgi:peptidylprolyl isomerase